MIDKATIADPKTKYGHGGTREFIGQRVTAAFNVLFTIFFVWFVVRLAGADRAEMVLTLRNPLVALALGLLVINVPMHMRIGMREIIEDYVHDPRLNRFSLMLNTFIALVIGLIGILAVLKIVIWG